MQKNKTQSNHFPRRRIQMGLTFVVAGFLILMVGVRPEIFQLDRSPVLGYVQIAVMLAGLAILCVGGYICLSGLWKGHSPSIAAELGMRIISTGYIIAVFAGLADIFGLGSHPYPEFVPYFGEWQARGVQIAEGFIAMGMLMMLPYSRHPFFHSRQAPPGDDHPD
ncbi:MAG: hypothetical protein Q8N39_04610 [Pelolinea sp.]|nr:hypothetical protein [Pelolinea sp.]